MRVLLIGLLFLSTSAFSIELSQQEKAYNLIHNILVQVSLKAPQHAQLEKALGILKASAKEAGDKFRADAKKALEDKIIKDYLKEKK